MLSQQETRAAANSHLLEQADFEFIAQPANRGQFVWIKGRSASMRQGFKPVKLAFCALNVAECVRRRHVLEVRLEDAQLCVLLTVYRGHRVHLIMGRIIEENASSGKALLGRDTGSQSQLGWPNHWLGETYAGHYSLSKSCIVRSSLLSLPLVATAESHR